MDIAGVVPRYFGARISSAVMRFNGQLCEIRLRASMPLAVTYCGEYAFLACDGRAVKSPADALTVTSEDIRRTFEALCRYSVHSFQNRINSGFITVSGGHRAGICGTAVYSPDMRIENIKQISSINFRIAREVIGSADAVSRRLMASEQKSVLICGRPGVGKTTVLRDLCRSMGNIFPVSLVDERCEIAAQSAGISGCDVGANTDVLSGYKKSDGIITAIRAMSPKMIFCDEIGSTEDISAIRLAAQSGAAAAASVHCGSPVQLAGRRELCAMIEEGIFAFCVFIADRNSLTVYTREEFIELFVKGGKG